MTKFEFDTPGEAAAFCRGVEYVNDSSIEIVEVREVGEKTVVFMEDEDDEVRESNRNYEDLDLGMRPDAEIARELGISFKN